MPFIQTKPPWFLQAYSDFVGGIDIYAWIDEWMGCEILEEYMFQLTEFSIVFLNNWFFMTPSVAIKFQYINSL
jgi:hypothetical protein